FALWRSRPRKRRTAQAFRAMISYSYLLSFDCCCLGIGAKSRSKFIGLREDGPALRRAGDTDTTALRCRSRARFDRAQPPCVRFESALWRCSKIPAVPHRQGDGALLRAGSAHRLLASE